MTPKISFVALTRVKKFNDFLIKPFSLDLLMKIKNSTCLKPRQEEEKRIEIKVQDTLNNFSNLYEGV